MSTSYISETTENKCVWIDKIFLVVFVAPHVKKFSIFYLYTANFRVIESIVIVVHQPAVRISIAVKIEKILLYDVTSSITVTCGKA